MQQASEFVVRPLQDLLEPVKHIMPAAKVNRSIFQGQVARGVDETLE
jgi:hypothetical protein